MSFDPNCLEQPLQNPVLLVAETDSLRLQMLLDLLRQAEIATAVRDNSTGNFQRLYMGSSCYASELFVEAEALAEAQELLTAYFADNGLEAEQPELTDHAVTKTPAQQPEVAESPSLGWRLRGQLVRLLVGVIVLLSVLSVIFGAYEVLRSLW